MTGVHLPDMAGVHVDATRVPALATAQARSRAHSAGQARRTKRVKAVSLNVLGLLIAIVTLLPIFLMISTAFKPSHEIYSLTPHLLPSHPTLDNFRQVSSGQVTGGIGSVWLFVRNSFGVALVTVVIASLLALLAAVGVARFRFRFRTTYLIMLLIVQMVPSQALIIALFLDFKRLNLLGSLTGIVLVYAAQALPVTIWMLRNFVATVPKELEEAAAIDGATGPKIFWRILLPLVAPGLVATSIFAFITAYNEFIVALTFLGQSHSAYTLPIFLTYFFGQHGAAWGPIMAASTIYTIPAMIFFLFVRRRLVGGLTAGAVKG
jgi:N,N'-diacetylchitobiose transport system permease protein